MEVLQVLFFCVVVLAAIAGYLWCVSWAIGDAEKRGRNSGLMVLLFFILGPVGALIWLFIRPAKTLIQQTSGEYSNAEDALAAATRLDSLGEWDAAVALYRSVAERWPEHSTYAVNCIGELSQKQKSANFGPSLNLNEVRKKQKNTLHAVAILAGFASLPLTWITIRDVQNLLPDDFTYFWSSAVQAITLNVTGLNGQVNLIVDMPLWSIISAAILANILQLMRSSGAFAVPKFVIWIVAVFAVICTSVPVLMLLQDGVADPGVGWLLGLFCATIPLLTLILPDQTAENQTTLWS